MVEVFKTDVSDEFEAMTILNALHFRFLHYKVNFDLEDCDNILRVESKNGNLRVDELLQFLHELGINAQILPD